MTDNAGRTAADMPRQDGKVIGPDGFLEWRGHPKKVLSSAHSRDLELARRLWEVSVELTGVRCASAAGRARGAQVRAGDVNSSAARERSS